MTQSSIPAASNRQPPEDEIKVLGVLLVFARHLRMIAALTIIAAAISTAVVMRKPALYTSSAKLLVLEFDDQTKTLRVGNDGRLVFGKREGAWKAADAAIIKSVMESAPLRQAVAKSLQQGQAGTPAASHNAVQIKQDKAVGIITVTVTGKDPDATARLATATVEESVRLGYRMGLLASSSLALDEKPVSLDGATTLVRLLEPAATGVKARSMHTLKIIVSAVSALFCGVFLAFAFEYFRNMSEEGRRRLADVRSVLKGTRRSSGSIE